MTVGVRDLGLCDNRVSNTRYTLLTFVPLVLYDQFSRWLNLYFLALACLQLVPGLSPTSPLATWLPLMFIVCLAAVREALDDWARRRRDAVFNRQHGHIRVGEVCVVREGEAVPCDGLLLGDEPCFCETMQLDGETDWKEKQPSGLQRGEQVEVPLPSASMALEGRATESRRAVGMGSVLLQGSVLRGSPRVELAAIYTGAETKMSLNRSEPRHKWTRLDDEINRSVVAVFALQLALAAAGGLCASLVAPVDGAAYLSLSKPWDVLPFVYALRFVLLFSLFIPISVLVTVTLAKFLLSSYCLQEGRANNTGVIDELGRVDTLCVDKTGTLTKNAMSVAQLWGCGEGEGRELLRAFCLCSSVTVLPDGTFQASSPDERALVEEAARRGVVLSGRRGETVELLVDGTVEQYRLLEVLSFASTRRRMAVLIEGPLPGRLAVYSKGADDVVVPRCGSEGAEAAAAALRFSRLGLRTLVVGRKTVERQLVAESGVLQARAELDGGLALERAFESLERRMQCLGVVGIRDELQDDVEATLRAVRSAGMRVWCITGDKEETARSVALSCGLWEAGERVTEWDGGLEAAEESSPEVLLVSGRSLEQRSVRLERALLGARVVLCSRASPKQKALLVGLLRERGQIVCAVGDGGNDVAMIQESNVGVGLAGKEGAQAALAADVALEHFAQLRGLLLWDGRHALQRVSFVAAFCFYKSMLLALGQAGFAAVSLFSGASLFSTAQLMLYNVLFTSLPLLSRLADVVPVFEEVRWSRMLAAWQARAACQAAVIFAIGMLAAGEDSELNLLAYPVYVASVLVATLTLLLEANTLSVWLLLATAAVPAAVFSFEAALAAVPFAREYGAFAGPQQVLAALLAVAVCLLPLLAWRAWRLHRAGVAAHRYAKLSDNEIEVA